MYKYYKTHRKSSHICERENRSLLRKGRQRGQKSVLTELDWASPPSIFRNGCRPVPDQTPHILCLLVAEHVAIAAIYDHTQERRAGRIPAVFRFHDLEGFLA